MRTNGTNARIGLQAQLGWRVTYDPKTGCLGLTHIELPLEITDLIVDYLSTDRSTLRALISVSRRWVPACRFHLFHSVVLRTFRVPAFLALIRYSPEIATCVHHLTLEDYADVNDFQNAISSYTQRNEPISDPSFGEIYISHWFKQKMFQREPTTEETIFEMQRIWEDGYMAIEPVLFRLRFLRSISFANFKFDGIWVERFLPSAIRYFTNLKGLALERCNFEEYPLAQFLSHFPKLTTWGMHAMESEDFEKAHIKPFLQILAPIWNSLVHVDLRFSSELDKQDLFRIVGRLRNIKTLDLELSDPLQVELIPDFVTQITSRNLTDFALTIRPDENLKNSSKHLTQHHFDTAKRIQQALAATGDALQNPRFDRLSSFTLHPMPSFRSIEWCFAPPLRNLRIYRPHMKFQLEFNDGMDEDHFFNSRGKQLMERVLY